MMMMVMKSSAVFAVVLLYLACLQVKAAETEVEVSKKENNFCPGCRARAPAFLGKRSGFPMGEGLLGEVTPLRMVRNQLLKLIGQLSRAEWEESNQLYQPKQYIIEA